MVYDKLYDMLLARRETRTITTQNLAIIASSASLLLLILYLPEAKELQKNFGNLIPVLGIIFPLIGIAYHEITYKTIHRFDNEVLNNLILKDAIDSQRKIIENKVIIYTENRGKRVFLLYLLFILPSLGWFVSLNMLVGLFVDIIILLIIFAFSLPSKSPKSSKFPKPEIPDFLKAEYKSEEDEDSLESEK